MNSTKAKMNNKYMRIKFSTFYTGLETDLTDELPNNGEAP